VDLRQDPLRLGWPEALAKAAEFLKAPADSIGVIAGDLACAEGMKATMDLANSLGVKSIDCRQDGAKLGLAADGSKLPRESYLFNATIAGLDQCDALLIVGANPRKEAPVLNARIRRQWLRRDMPVALIGERVDLTYDYSYVGASAESLGTLKAGDNLFDALVKAKRPMVIVGQGALTGAGGGAVLHAISKLAADIGAFKGDDKWNGFNVLHTAAARVGGLDMGFLPAAGGKDVAGILEGASSGAIKTVLLLGADEIDTQKLSKASVIYIGSHGDNGAHRADVILPSAAYTEKSATYVNTEGRVQRTQRAVAPKGEAREDWAILRALSAVVGKQLPYDTLAQLRTKLSTDHPTFLGLDYAPGYTADAKAPPYGSAGSLPTTPIFSTLGPFHLTNPIARASRTMAECAELAAGKPAIAAE
jgi:NADH-quinone oxidoreductase subunit G